MDTNKLYNELKKYVGGAITKDNVFKAVVFAMKLVKSMKVEGSEKKKIVINTIMMLVDSTNVDEYVDRDLVEITLEMVYDSFKTDVFKKSSGCC